MSTLSLERPHRRGQQSPRTTPKIRSVRTRHPALSAGLLIPAALAVLFVLAALWPGLFATASPTDPDVNAVLAPPSAAHWFGTDQLGRDVYTRVVYGASQSLSIGLGATILALVAGVLYGAAAALAPKGLDRVLAQVLSILLAFPELLLALLVIAVLGRGPLNTALAVGLAASAGYARLVRAQVLSIRLSGYVEAARALGESRSRILFGHILPNAFRPLLVLATLGLGSAVLAASALSFLGLGVVPPEAEWGALLADGRNYLDIAPWTSLWPATIVAVCVISFTLTGRRLHTLSQGGIV